MVVKKTKSQRSRENMCHGERAQRSRENMVIKNTKSQRSRENKCHGEKKQNIKTNL